VIQLLLFGFALDLNVRQVKTIVLDPSPSQRSRELIQRLANSDVFDLRGAVQSPDELYAAIRKGTAAAAIRFPHDYAERLIEGRAATVQLLVDGSDSSVSGAAVNGFNAVILTENQRLAAALGYRPVIEARPAVLYNPASLAPNFFIPGMLAILVQIMVILLVALSVVRERERGTLEQLTMTPVRPLGVMLGKLLPYLGLGMLEVSMILLAMRGIFRVPVHGEIWVLIVLTVPLLVAAGGLGLLISTKAQSQAEAFQLAMGTMLPSIFLSGYIFPIGNMPLPFQYLGRMLPATYYINITRGVILRGAALRDIWQDGAVLLLMAAILIALAALQFQRRLS
jgi:ABC-2 type transport system permease protein